MDRRRIVPCGRVLGLETRLARSCDNCRGRPRRHAPKRVAQARGPSASSVSRWLVRRLVGLQFCQRAYHRSHFAVWSIAFVSAATDEIEALAKIEHPFRGDAGDAGVTKPPCSRRVVSRWRKRGDFSRCFLADDLRARVRAYAT